MSPKIFYTFKNENFHLKNKMKIKSWILESIKLENKKLGELNFIFCSDKFLLKYNVKYLNHNTYTDVITFDYSDNDTLLIGDIFISIDRVIENSKKNKNLFYEELRTVMIHGVLHLIGYNDSTEEEKNLMRKIESKYIELWNKEFSI